LVELGIRRIGFSGHTPYGEKVGFRYYEDEDLGIFWSNDPATPIRRMTDALGLLEAEEDLARVRAVYGKAGVPGY